MNRKIAYFQQKGIVGPLCAEILGHKNATKWNLLSWLWSVIQWGASQFESNEERKNFKNFGKGNFCQIVEKIQKSLTLKKF